MKSYKKSKKYPLHVALCKRLHKQGVSDREIAERLRVNVIDVRAWTSRLRSPGVVLFRDPPVGWPEGGRP